MKNTPALFHVADILTQLHINKHAKTAILYLDSKTVIRATWHFKPKSNNLRETAIITFGAPNFAERETIKKFKKAKMSVEGQIQLKAWPKKRAAACK